MTGDVHRLVGGRGLGGCPDAAGFCGYSRQHSPRCRCIGVFPGERAWVAVADQCGVAKGRGHI